jgi:hypothetical protein
MTTQIQKYLSQIGRKGGQSGTGEAKKRGDSEHYKMMRAAREAKRAARER